VAVGEVEQHHVAGLALDERADRGTVVRAANEVALPVTGDCSVGDFGWRSEIVIMSGSTPAGFCWPLTGGRV